MGDAGECNVTVTGALRAFQPSTGSFDPLIEVAPYRAAG
jgi:hypothetical protein